MISPKRSSSPQPLASRNWIKWFTWMAIVCLLILPQTNARADMGPKPSMEFIFEQDNDPPLTIVAGELLVCSDKSCTHSKPLEELGPQGFGCTADGCSSLAYGYQQYHRIRIRFSDGVVRESNVFGKRFFDATYQVQVRADDLVVEEDIWRSNSANSMFFAFILWVCAIPGLFVTAILALVWLSIRAKKEKLSFGTARGAFIVSWIVAALMVISGSLFSLTLPLTVIIEAVLAAGYARMRQRSMVTVLTLVTLANAITQPLLLLGLSAVDTEGQIEASIYLLVFEILIWLGEALMLYLPQRKETTFKEALGLSLALNATSFLIGLFLRL